MLLNLLVKLFLKLMHVLALVLPVTLVTYNVLQILVGIHIITAYNLRSVLNDIFRQTYLAGYLNGERTAGITYLQNI